MHLPSRPLALAGALALGAFASGCSYGHGPLSDKPDTTSLGNAGRFGPVLISTADGLAVRPAIPGAVVPGTVQGETSPFTTQVRPPMTLLGTREDWSFGESVQPEDGWAVNTWTSGPVLPVEPWNMAMEPAEGEGHAGGRGGHGGGH